MARPAPAYPLRCDAMARARGTDRTRRTRRTRRFVLLGVFVVLLAWGAFVALAIVRARHDTHLGIATLQSVQQKLTPGQLLRGEGVPELRTAEADFTRARH